MGLELGPGPWPAADPCPFLPRWVKSQSAQYHSCWARHAAGNLSTQEGLVIHHIHAFRLLTKPSTCLGSASPKRCCRDLADVLLGSWEGLSLHPAGGQLPPRPYLPTVGFAVSRPQEALTLEGGCTAIWGSHVWPLRSLLGAWCVQCAHPVLQVGEVCVPAQCQTIDVGDSELGWHKEEVHQLCSRPHAPISLWGGKECSKGRRPGSCEGWGGTEVRGRRMNGGLG